jgi:hypothetical protein
MLPGDRTLQVLCQGHVEGGARPAWSQEDRLQGDREKKGDGKKSAEAAADGLLAQSKGSGLSDAEVAIVSTAMLGSKFGTTHN